MSALLFLVGLVFFVSGLLSILNVSEVGLTFVSMTQIHQLPFLISFQIVWVYILLGVILIAIAGGLSRRRG
jgi:hypothetical protein